MSPRESFLYVNDDQQLTGLRYDNWKIVFMEQRVQGTLRIRAEPFTTWSVAGWAASCGCSLADRDGRVAIRIRQRSRALTLRGRLGMLRGRRPSGLLQRL